MNEVVRNDILSVLRELAGILEVKEEKDSIEIKNLSNKVIHNASVFQDEDSISIAVLVYALSKLIERMHGQLNYEKFFEIIKKAVDYLKVGDEANFRISVKNIFKLISSIDSKLKMYIEEVINQAQIKKGCKLCAHGISAARASEIMGISQWELLNYIGKTMITDKFTENINVKRRIEYTRKIFT